MIRTAGKNTMTSQSWNRVKELLHQAMQLALGDRAPFLDRACDSDDSLRAEVKSFLAAEEDLRPSFVRSRQTAELGANVSDRGQNRSVAALQAGQVFAERFQIVRELGEGGIGQVWLAEQSSPVRRQVALKLIKAGMYDEAVVQRFRAERQSLAIMDHPAIAKVFHAGATRQWSTVFCDGVSRRVADRGILRPEEAQDRGSA
jgi:eukaryotic-like serine/threonine-protein kinase